MDEGEQDRERVFASSKEEAEEPGESEKGTDVGKVMREDNGEIEGLYTNCYGFEPEGGVQGTEDSSKRAHPMTFSPTSPAGSAQWVSLTRN